ncbi:hypothetical protein GQ53DRAFT_822348 [Thozetella sp. PMI_491]|nr:hypothetical protein GQ53DRAFT_822348 [Thozetella sp. PMI_491]
MDTLLQLGTTDEFVDSKGARQITVVYHTNLVARITLEPYDQIDVDVTFPRLHGSHSGHDMACVAKQSVLEMYRGILHVLVCNLEGLHGQTLMTAVTSTIAAVDRLRDDKQHQEVVVLRRPSLLRLGSRRARLSDISSLDEIIQKTRDTLHTKFIETCGLFETAKRF